MLKPERVTFSADDDKFQQFANSEQLDTFLNDSLVHYSTDFKKTDQQELSAIKQSKSLTELSSLTMSSQEQQPQTEHEPPTSAPPSLISEQIPILNENNLHQLDALTLQQLAIGSNQPLSNINEEETTTSPPRSTSLADIQKEIDRVKQMKYGRTYSSPTSSLLCPRLTTNPFNGPNNNIDLSAITHSVHFTEQPKPTNHLPFSSTYITSIPESIVPASDSSSTNENHFIPIHYIESPSLEDREVFETFHTKQTSAPGVAIRQSIDSLNRNISTSETDLIASLHRSASKQALDNQSDHGTTLSGTSDDMIFVEWDKERSLFQDYINSLRTEIRVLLQERLEYQKQMETINNNLSERKRLNLTQINTDQTKLDLLQKSLEEKNLVLEQIQTEYEILKEKNSNLTRKVSNLRCDSKAQTGVIDELKQKIAELTVDIQNHILVKRRLEISIMNLESDCKIIDAERIRLNNDIKETQSSKQDLEKLLQQANVQIAEQGSTIEMLRSDNIQIRSQLSATQRRMLQEKQQVMDYLRQIENDLVEKEQIKQRESILRKDFEKLQIIHKQDRQEIDQLNLQINQDQQKLTQLEQERLQLLKTIQNLDDKQTQVESELDSYKSATKRLSTHFKIPFDSIQSMEQLIPMLEDRYRTQQVSHARIHDVPLVQSTSESNNQQETEDVRQLREDLASMNIQLKQLEGANQAWQQYQQNQLVLLRDRLNLTDVDNGSFEDIVQQIEHRFNDLNNQLIKIQDVKKTDIDTDRLQQLSNELQNVNTQLTADNLHRSKDTQTEDNEEYQRQQEVPIENNAIDVSQYEGELRQLREDLAALTTQCAQLDEANKAWQQYHQTQLDSFRNKLQNSLSIKHNSSLDDIAQHIVAHLDQIQNDRENLMQQLQTSEKLNQDIRSESTTDNQTIHLTYANTINELNQQLHLLKQQNDQLETEKFILNQQLENQSSISLNQERNTPTPDSISSDSRLGKKHMHPGQIQEAQIHNITPVQSSSPLINEHEQELQQLRQNLTLLTDQCAQLNEANHAWQLYQQTQLDNFRNTIQQYLPIDENLSLEHAAQQIVDRITKERQDSTEQYHALQRANDHLRSESVTNLETIKESYINTINELNEELLAMKEKSEQTNDFTSAPLLTQTVDEISTTSNGSVDEEELRYLRENVVSLTGQLDETNRAWKQYQQIVDQVTKEREDLSEKYTELEKANNNLRSESSDTMESIRQSFINTVNELNQELLAMKEAYEQLDSERQVLLSELEKRPVQVDEAQARQNMEEVPRNTLQQPFREIPIHTSGVDSEQEAEVVQQLRENVALLTSQCAQLDAANLAWQQYQLTQLNNFRSKLADYIPVDENTSFDEMAQRIVDQINEEREDFKEKYQALERVNNDRRSELSDNMESMRQSYMNTANELNQKLLTMKDAYDQLDSEKQFLVNELEKRPVQVDQEQVRQTIEKIPSELFKQPFAEVPIHTSGTNAEQDAQELRQLQEKVAFLTDQCAQLDVANRAWQQYQRTQSDSFRSKLADCLPIDENTSFDQIAQQIVDQITKEREDFNGRFQAIEKANNDLRSESTSNLESIKESYMNTVNELNQELLAMKEVYDQLDAEKQVLINELEKRPIEVAQEKVNQTIEKVPSNTLQQAFREVPIHTSGANVRQDAEELQQLRESVALLTTRCAQLDEANQAWQLYQRTQLDNFRAKFVDCLPIDETLPLDQTAQQIVNQITKEREDFHDKYTELAKVNDDLRSESATDLETTKQSYTNSVNELNQELLAMKEAYEQRDNEKQVLISELEKRTADLDQQQQDKQIRESSPINLSHEVSIDTNSPNVEQENEELRQLRENFALLTSQYAQLNEANQAWQEFHQSQLNNFHRKVQDCIQIDDDFSFDQIAQQVVDQITKEREDFTRQYQTLEKAINDLQSESIQEKKDLLIMKEQYQQVLGEKEILVHQIENQPVINNQEQDTQTIESTNSYLLEQQTEMFQLRENLASLTSQLDETNRAWQTFYDKQIDLLKDKLKNYIYFDNNLNFDQIIQLILTQLEQQNQQLDSTEDNLGLLKNQLNDSQQKEQVLNQQILTLQNACQTLEQQLIDHQYLIDSLKNNFELISNENEQFKQQFNELQETNDLLMNNNQNLRYQLERPSSPFVSQENLKQARHTPIQNAQIHTVTPVQSAPTPNLGVEEAEELQQLRTQLLTLTTQCAQLDGANRAWQQYHQNQLEIFRNKLQDWVLLDDNSTLEQIAQQIVIQLDQLGNNQQNDNQLDSSATIDSLNKQLVNYQLNESILAKNFEELNQKLVDVHQECAAIREHNAQLILSKQQIEQQSEERQQQINDFQSNSRELFHLQQYNDSLQLENQQLQFKLNETEQRLGQLAVQHVDPPRETVASHDTNREDEIQQLRTDLAAASAHCLQLEETNSAWQKYQYEQIESFKQKLQEQIPLFNQIENPSLDLIAQSVVNYLEQLNIERDNLIRQNDLLKDDMQLQKQQIERPGSADGGKRMFRRLSQEKHSREAQIHNVTPVQSSSPLINEHEQELQQLRQNLTLLTDQCAQLNEANHAWQLYQQTQLDNFRNTIQQYLPIDENLSLEHAAQQIVDQITKERQDSTEQYHALQRANDHLRSESVTNLETIKESYINTINELNEELLAMKEKSEQINHSPSSPLLTQTVDEVPVTSSESVDNEELRQLRENVVSLTSQLHEANRAWQLYQQTQLDNFRNTIQHYLPIDENLSLEQTAQQIVDRITKERQESSEQYRALERTNNDIHLESVTNLETIKESYINTINELNEELLAMKEKSEQTNDFTSAPLLTQTVDEDHITSSESVDEEELRQLRDNLAALTTQLDQRNRAWEQYQLAQLNSFRSKLADCMPLDENTSLDEMAQQVANQVTKAREDFSEKYADLEKANNNLQSESRDTIESIRKSNINTVNELNQELLAMKEAYEQVDNERQALISELEKRPVPVDEVQARQNIEEMPSTTLQQSFDEAPVYTSGVDSEQEAEELQQLRENVALLTSQCAQLEAANGAWQQYQLTQLDSFRRKLADYIPIDENTSFDEMAQQVVDQVTKEREDFSEKYADLEKANNNLQSESSDTIESIRKSNINTVNELNQELLAMKEAYEQLDNERQVLISELEKRSSQVDEAQTKQNIENVSPTTLQQPSEEAPVYTSGVDSEQEAEELQQLRENVALLTSQCAQLEAANGAWQQYQLTQLDSFRRKLADYIPIDENTSLDEMAQQVANQVTKEREDFSEKYADLEKANNNLQSESSDTIESIRKSNINTVNELNQELLAVKEAYEQLDNERQALISELEKRPVQVDEAQTRQNLEEMPSNTLQQPFDEVPVHNSDVDGEQEAEELQQLRENVALLTSQCAQLEAANGAWQQYQLTQLDSFRRKLADYIPLDENTSFDEMAQQVANQVTKEREDFSEKHADLEKANNNLQSESSDTVESIRQFYLNTVNELNRELLAMREGYEQLDNERQVLISELEKRPSQVDEEHARQNIENVSLNTLQQPFEEVPVHNSGVDGEQEVEELQQLRENVALLTSQCAQLDAANLAWQQYQLTQLDSFRSKLADYIPIDENTSLDEMAQRIIDRVAEERENFDEKYQALERANNDLQSESTNAVESIRESYINTVNELNQALLAMREAYEQLDNERQVLISELEKRPVQVDEEQAKQNIENVPPTSLQQAFDEVPVHNSGVGGEQEAEVQQLRENVAFLTSQCAQLDAANRAWQQYQLTQLDSFRSKLVDYIPIDDNISFDEMAQQIVDQINEDRKDFKEKYQALERVNYHRQSDDKMESNGESHMNTINELKQELLTMKEAYEQLDAEKQVLISELEKQPLQVDEEQAERTAVIVPSSIWKQPFKEVPIQTSSVDVEQKAEELQELRDNVVALTAQCAQLNEANEAWQQYQQSQLANFRTKLHDYLPLDGNTSFDEIAQLIVDQISKEREEFSDRYAELEKINDNLRTESALPIQSNEQSSAENIDELNEELRNLKNQYEELEKINKQLLIEKEDLSNQLNDRSIVVGHHSAFESNLVEDGSSVESKDESERQSSPIPNEPEEIRQIRSDLASITSQFTELTEANQTELNAFRNKLQNWMSLSPNSTLDEIAQQLNTQFEQQQNLPETTENQTQTTEPTEKVHIAIETIPLTYENHQTQIDPIDMIDQQIQTESFQQLWSTSDDENLLKSDEDDDRLKDYIDEITSLSSIDLSDRLNKECQQILSKQNFEKDSYSKLDLNHLALITIYSLYNQHLTDDAKHLYNETVIRALKQEYELINTEKNDYMEKYFNEIDSTEKKFHQLQNQYDDLLEQNELERLDSKQSLKDVIDKYELNLYNLHQENEQFKSNLKNLEQNYPKINEQDYEQLEKEYQQLKHDYDEIINENELLKDYNSQMYQKKLQDNDPDVIKSSHDIDVQCNLSEKIQLSDWNEDNTNRDLPVQEEGLENSSNKEEINRLKAIISEIQRDNENLKESNSQNANLSSSTHQSILIDSYVQTETETETEQISSPQTEDNDWNVQMPPLEIPSDEQNLSSTIKQTSDNETQTDDQAQDKLAQVNNKLKRALQTIKEKIHQAVADRPELFPDANDDTIERLDHLIAAIENQATQIEILHNEREHLLQRNQQLEQDIQSNIDTLSSDQRVSNDNSTQTDSDEGEQTTKITDEEEPSLTNRLFGFISNVTSTSRTNETLDNETQTEEQPQDKLTQVNNKLKRALQTIKEKIHQAVIERSELFPDIGDDTIERLDHLISAIGNQAIQIDLLQNERNHAQQEINQLQSSLEAYQYQIDNERGIKTKQLVSAAPTLDDNSQSTMDDYEKQIGELQQNLSQNEDERILLRQRLNEVELEFRKTLDDHASTSAMYEEQLQSLVQERNALVEQQVVQSAESQREIEQLQDELTQLKQTPVTSNEDIRSLQEVIQQQSDELRDLSEKYFDLSSQIDAQDGFDKQKKDTEERLSNYENQIEHLLREHANLLEEVQKNASSSAQTTDNESQTDDQQHDKLVQINNKLKRVLQTFKEKIHRIATERPDLFVNIGDETSERLDSLISTVERQSTQIDILQAERDQSEEQLRNEIQELHSSLEACQHELTNERSVKAEQLVSAPPSSDDISPSTIEDDEKQIKQLQQKLSQNEDERILLRQRLNEVELEFRKTLDDHASTSSMYEEQLQSLVQERNALVEQQVLQSAENQREMEQLQQELSELRQSSVNQPVDLSSNEEIQSLKEEIEQKSDELKDLNEKYLVLSSQLDSNVDLQSEFDRQSKEIGARLIDYEKQIENLTRERGNLLEEIRKNASSSVSIPDSEKQVDDQQYDKLVRINNKLKRALQTFKEKIHRVVTERPELFANVGEETSERVDHLISTVERQATQIDILQAERGQSVEQLQNEIRELQGSVEAYRYQIENERPVKTERLVFAAPSSDDTSPSTIEDNEKQIKHLQQKLSQNEDERILLRQRLNEVELEFRKTLDDHASTSSMYEEQLQSLVQERNAFVEQQALQFAESQHEIEQLQGELAQLKQSDKDITSLNEIIGQQSEELKHLNEKYNTVSSELDRQRQETEARLTGYENQIENLTRERANLLEEIRKNASSSVSIPDNEKQADEQQHDKLVRINNKLKRALQTFRDKIHRVVTERPDLFTNVGEETSERVDHLVSTVEHQATQIDILKAERNEIEEQLRNEIAELQNAFDIYRQRIDDENQLKHISSPPDPVHKMETETTEEKREIPPSQTSNDNQWNDWSTESSQISDEKLQYSTDQQEPSVANRLFGFLKNVTSPWSEETSTNDWNDQTSPLQLQVEESQQTISSPSSTDNLIQTIQNKLQQIVSNYPDLFPHANEDILNNLDEFNSIIENLQHQISQLQSFYQAQMDESNAKLSIYQKEIEHLTEERDEAKQSQKHIEIQTDNEPLTPSGERISRRVFEQEMLAWSRESEQLKQYVKLIQIQNQKLKDIILKFERITHDYMYENERLKQENQQLSLLSYSPNTENFTASDTDICYLTLKCLTYEVAQRTADENNEQSLFITDDNEPDLKQRLIDTERQLKRIRIQNQKLKKQVETYTIQFTRIQHEMNIKTQELDTLKIETDRLRTSETQYRLEVDRLKVDLQCNEVKFQHLERELTDLKLERTNIDNSSTNNLHELLELKERELNALKEKLDYTIQAHQLELQEAIKANQFSLDNVQRFEQLDQRHQEKRKELETRLGKICKIVRPLIDNQYLFSEESMIDMDELQQLITDTEAEERVIHSLGPIRDCLGLLESQMKELQYNLIENHARRSKRSKNRSGFDNSLSSSPWGITSDVPDSNLFLEPMSTDFLTNDVRLCLDDLLDEVIVRTTVK